MIFCFFLLLGFNLGLGLATSIPIRFVCSKIIYFSLILICRFCELCLQEQTHFSLFVFEVQEHWIDKVEVFNTFQEQFFCNEDHLYLNLRPVCLIHKGVFTNSHLTGNYRTRIIFLCFQSSFVRKNQKSFEAVSFDERMLKLLMNMHS